MKIDIIVTYSLLLPRVKQHLSVVGKRARTVDGKPLFSDIMASTNEDSFFNDLFDMAAENLVASLPDLSTTYTPLTDVTSHKKSGVKFTYISNRWTTDFEGFDGDLTKALSEATSNYLVNYALSQFLTDIHPSTGAKYPPLWGQTYIEHSAVIINNIRSLALLKRPVVSDKSYSSISATKS